MDPKVTEFRSSNGARIFRIPCEVFPSFIGHCFFVLDVGPPTLIDVGSGYADSTRHLLEGFEEIRHRFGVPLGIADVERIIITHGHIDHFGGASAVRERAPNAELGVHVLDRRVLTAYEERVIVATKALRGYLQRAGVDPQTQAGLIEMYGVSKKHVHSIRIDFTIADGQTIDGMDFYHAPGHCPGQVCIGLGDVLLSADHVLERTSPHQAPESITPYTGLGHYLEALQKIHHLSGFRIALGGHEKEIPDLYSRIDHIQGSHARKLERVADMVRESDEPATIVDITRSLYPRASGFHYLLALEEAGAHVEYLYQRGDLAVVNLDEVEREENPAQRFRLA